MTYNLLFKFFLFTLVLGTIVTLETIIQIKVIQHHTDLKTLLLSDNNNTTTITTILSNNNSSTNVNYTITLTNNNNNTITTSYGFGIYYWELGVAPEFVIKSVLLYTLFVFCLVVFVFHCIGTFETWFRGWKYGVMSRAQYEAAPSSVSVSSVPEVEHNGSLDDDEFGEDMSIERALELATSKPTVIPQNQAKIDELIRLQKQQQDIHRQTLIAGYTGRSPSTSIAP